MSRDSRERDVLEVGIAMGENVGASDGVAALMRSFGAMNPDFRVAWEREDVVVHQGHPPCPSLSPKLIIKVHDRRSRQ